MFFLFKHNLLFRKIYNAKSTYISISSHSHTQSLLMSSLWFKILRQAFRLCERENEPHQASKLPITCTSVVGNTVPQIHILAISFLTFVVQNTSPTRLSRWIRTHLCKTFLKNVWWIIKFTTHTVCTWRQTVINHAIWLKWRWVPDAHHHVIGDFSHCRPSNRLGCPSPGICLGHQCRQALSSMKSPEISLFPPWKSPIAWENSWHAITFLCACVPGYFARIHVLIVTFPPLIWNHTLPMSVSPLAQNYQQGNQQHISSAITLTSCSCLFFVPRHPMMDSNNLLDPLCHTKVVQHGQNTEWSPKYVW